MFINFAIEIITHPQNKLVPVSSAVNLTCASSLSSNVIIWSHDGVPINESATTSDTSILTITSVKESDAGSYVCTVTSLYSGLVSVTSKNAILTVYGTYVYA